MFREVMRCENEAESIRPWGTFYFPRALSTLGSKAESRSPGKGLVRMGRRWSAGAGRRLWDGVRPHRRQKGVTVCEVLAGWISAAADSGILLTLA